MARWVAVKYASVVGDHGALFDTSSLIAFLSTLLVFSVCVTMLLALCAVRSHHTLSVLNAERDRYNSETSVRESLATAPPRDEFLQKQELNVCFSSSGSTPVIPKLSSASAAINKLGSSFRISSFRDPAASFRNSAFRISSFKLDSCKQVDGIADSLRRVRPAGVEEEESKEPAVWQRAILQGERCAPLSFSGLILYDVHGNQLPSFRADAKDSNLLKKQLAP